VHPQRVAVRDRLFEARVVARKPLAEAFSPIKLCFAPLLTSAPAHLQKVKGR
jgi:hypothetical protein